MNGVRSSCKIDPEVNKVQYSASCPEVRIWMGFE